MPPPPEFRRVFRHQRVVEVFEEAEAEHPTEADRHVGVAREVEIELEGEEHGSGPAGEQGDVREAVEGVDDRRAGVGDQGFLGKSLGEAEKAVVELGRRNRAGVQLSLDVLVAHDGSRDQLGEEGNVEQETEEGLLHVGVLPVHVDHVGHGLEGEKADADGHGYRDDGDRDAEHRVHRLRQKAEVFIKSQHPEVRNDGEGQPELPPRLHPGGADQPSEKVVRRHKTDHQENAHRFSPRIEKKRKRDKNAAAVCVVFQYEICQHQKRQEHIEEKEVGKYHVGFAFPAPACFPSTGAVILYHSEGGL